MVGGNDSPVSASKNLPNQRQPSISASVSSAQPPFKPATPDSPSTQPRETPTSACGPTTTASSQAVIQEPTQSEPSNRAQTASHGTENLNQHSRGFDQSGFPLSSDARVISSSPSSPRLQPTYRSTRSLGGSEASSPSRIKVRDLSHIQSFANEELLARSRSSRRSGPGYSDSNRQYEISSMPVVDIIEMVAGLLSKITTTNDLQHEHVHKPIPPPEEAANLSPQTSSVLAFHGKNVPSITILSYLSRIHKYCPTTYEVFLSLLVYFDRMTEMVNRGLLKNMEERRANPSAQPNTSPESSTLMSLDSPPTNDRPPNSTSISEDYVPAAERQDSATSPTSPTSAANPGDLAQFFVVDSYNIHRLVIAGVTCASKFFSDVFYTNSRYAKVGGLPLNELNHLELQFLLLNDFRLSVPVEELEAYGTMLVEFYAREVVTQQQIAAQQNAQRLATAHGGDGMYMREGAARSSQIATSP